jgi:prepilin-type N-terminal cleavage/methylation domain-containing protein
MNTFRRAGFTLIELLTVIAIIAILAGMIMVVGPRLIERSKIARMQNALKQVNTSLVAYMTDSKGSYPPGYGFVAPRQAEKQGPSVADQFYFNLRPYLFQIGNHGELGLYDEFSKSYDTNSDGVLSLLEFSPAGTKQPDGTWKFDWTLPRYNRNNDAGEVSLELGAKQRPFIYVPVNLIQAKRAAKYWIDNKDFLAKTWPANPGLPGVTFPPVKYDAFVLIGVGPYKNTFGLVDDPPFLAQVDARDAYHIAALRAYFLATRDLNANGQLDFDFTARTQAGEGKMTYTVNGAPCDNQLPCNMPNGAGPVIYVSGK